MPSSSKYKKATVLFEVNEVHMGRSLQVSTKLPFLRKYSLYSLFLDLRYFSFAKIPLRKHFSFWQLPKNKNKSKRSKMQTQITILRKKKTEEASLRYWNSELSYVFPLFFFCFFFVCEEYFLGISVYKNNIVTMFYNAFQHGDLAHMYVLHEFLEMDILFDKSLLSCSLMHFPDILILLHSTLN